MATIPSELTWAVGQIVNASQMNSNVRDAVLFLLGGSAGQRPLFEATQNAVQSIANNTEVAVIFQNTQIDTDSGYNAATGLYTVKTAGTWLFTATLQFANNATGKRGIHLNQGFYTAWNWVDAAAVDQSGRISTCFTGRCSVNDGINVNAFQVSGAGLNTAGSSACTFAGTWLSS